MNQHHLSTWLTRRGRLVILMLWLFAAGACTVIPPIEDKTAYYTLPSIAENQPEKTGKETSEVSDTDYVLMPVEIPQYLDRPSFVHRTGQGSVKVFEYTRWAEPLQQSIHRSLLHALWPVAKSSRLAQEDAQLLTVEILRFEPYKHKNNEVKLLARCYVQKGSHQEPSSFTVELTSNWDGNHHEKLTQKMSQLIQQLAGQIKENLRK